MCGKYVRPPCPHPVCVVSQPHARVTPALRLPLASMTILPPAACKPIATDSHALSHGRDRIRRDLFGRAAMAEHFLWGPRCGRGRGDVVGAPNSSKKES